MWPSGVSNKQAASSTQWTGFALSLKPGSAECSPETRWAMTEFRWTMTLSEFSKQADRLYDVCIVGSGAAGSVVASHCAAQGLDVLILERVDHPHRRTFDENMEDSEPAYARAANGC